MVGEAEVVVAGQVDDFPAIVVADGGLLVVENTELEMGAFGAEFIEDGGKVGKLRAARDGFSHDNAPQTNKDSAEGGF